jgi:hypothetical protein
MKATSEPSSARRSFLRLLGGVMAGGVGAIAVGGTAHAAQPRTGSTGAMTTTGSKAGGVTPNACAIFCTKVCCACCASGGHTFNLFHCVAGPCGYDYYECDNHSCASYCLSQNAC